MYVKFTSLSLKYLDHQWLSELNHWNDIILLMINNLKNFYKIIIIYLFIIIILINNLWMKIWRISN